MRGRKKKRKKDEKKDWRKGRNKEGRKDDSLSLSYGVRKINIKQSNSHTTLYHAAQHTQHRTTHTAQ